MALRALLGDIFGDANRRAMIEAGSEPVARVDVGWSEKHKALHFVYSRKNIHRAIAIRLFSTGNGVTKVSETEKTESWDRLAEAIKIATEKVGRISVVGNPITDPWSTLDNLLSAQEFPSKSKEKQIALPVQQPVQIPVYGNPIGYVWERGEVTNTPVFISENMLVEHLLITGMTKSGKTELAKRIVSEVRKMGRPAVVVTPEPQVWESSFEDSLVINESDWDDDPVVYDAVNIISTFDCEDRAEETARILDAIVRKYASSGPTDRLELLFVVDEAHVLMKNPEHAGILDKAARQLRKFGGGCVFISQSYYDFETRGIRTNVHTHIAMRSRWEKDIQQLKQFLPKDMAEQVRNLENGHGIFISQAEEFGKSLPFVCRFLRQNEVMQPAAMKPPAFDGMPEGEVGGRRSAILDVVRSRWPVSVDGIRPALQNIGIEIDDVTIYRDLSWLEERWIIRVVEVKGKGGRKYYAPA
jgi:hypothetical protein